MIDIGSKVRVVNLNTADPDDAELNGRVGRVVRKGNLYDWDVVIEGMPYTALLDTDELEEVDE